MDWHSHIRTILPHVMRITTPQGSGTGFLVRRQGSSLGIATAGHVLRDAVAWKQQITIHHPNFESPVALFDHARTVILHPSLDSAYIQCELPELQGDTFPEEPIEVVPIERNVRPGVEVGWLGFPYLVSSETPCFFAGHVSAYVDRRYFIDGVAIPGVSGGPAFCRRQSKLYILGSISAYHPARAAGEAIPGLLVADDCKHWSQASEE